MSHKNYKTAFTTLHKLYLIASIAIILLLTACREQATPRPNGYFRIDAYPACYHIDTLGNVSLQVNDSALCMTPSTHTADGVEWLNITYPRYRATIYLSYIPLADNLERLMAESIELVYRQNVNTQQVEAIAYENSDAQLYATLYTLSAQSATPIQFIATDSLRYLLRGALYFDNPVKADSVAPALQYIETDIMQMIESITYTTR